MFHKFKYYLLDKDGKSFFIENNVVKSSSLPQPLPETPDGWQNISIGYERSLSKPGLVRNFTLPLNFVRTANRILKTIVYSFGVGIQVSLLIQKLKSTVDMGALTWQLLYSYFYKGDVDLTTFQDQDIKTVLTVAEGGIAPLVKANEGTATDIPIDSDKEAVMIKWDGINLQQKHNFLITEGNTVGTHLFNLSFLNSDGQASGVVPFSVQSDYTTTSGPTGSAFNPATSQDYFLQATGDALNSNISGTISLLLAGPFSTTDVTVSLRSNTGRNMNIFFQAGASGQLLININYTFDILKDEKYFLQFLIGAGIETVIIHETNLTVSYSARYPPTYVKALKVSTVAKRLSKFVTGADGNIDTTFLEANDNLFLASGDAIRSLPGAAMKTHLNDYSEFVHVVLAASQGIESNKLLFREFSYFLNPASPVPLGGASNFKSSYANDIAVNTVKIGYPAQQIDDVNGKYSSHNTFLFAGPGKVAKELTLVSPYIADPYYAELTRINLEGKTTTDDKADNVIFVLDCAPSGITFVQSGVVIDTDTNGSYFSIPGFPDEQQLFKTQFVVSGTASNDGTYTVKNVVPGIGGYTVYVYENVVTESPTSIQIGIIYYILNRPTGLTVTGVPDPATIFNLMLSPKRLMAKHAIWINSLFYGFAGQKLKFQTTEKNADLKVIDSSGTTEEKADYEIGTSILFKPFYFEFDTEVPTDLVDTLDTNPNRPLTPQWYGDSFDGFILKAGISPNDNKAQSYKLLCGPNTDLTKLIKHG